MPDKKSKETRKILWFWMLVGASVVFALTLIVVGILTSDDSSAFGLEAAKIGLQFLAIVIIGGAIGFGFKSLESRRTDRQRQDEYRISFLDGVLDTYNSLKKVRRTLRAWGFRPSTPGAPAGSPQQVETFHAQMDLVTDAQLSLERAKRKVASQRWLFAPDDRAIAGALDKAEDYVEQVWNEWELYGDAIPTQGTAGQAWSNSKHLQLFLERVRKGGSFGTLSSAVASIEDIVGTQLLAAD